MKKRLAMTIFITVVVGLILVQFVQGKEFPTRPIEIVVTYGPGSINDMVSRLCGEIGKKYLSQPLVVVNKTGAGGSTGVSDVINSKPDGHKILYMMNNYFATTIRTQKAPFDPSHLVPLINLIECRQGLGVSGNSPWKTINQLLEYGKKNPGKIRVGHAGRGTGGHILLLVLFKKAGVEIIDIPYAKGNADIIPALLGGHLDAAFIIYSTTKSLLEAGKLRFLVTSSDERYPVTPDIPCAAELGFDNFIVYHGIYIHKDTPEDIKKTLSEAFKKICEDPEFKKGLDNMGDAPKFGGPEFIRESIKKVERIGIPVIKDLGLYAGEPPKF